MGNLYLARFPFQRLPVAFRALHHFAPIQSTFLINMLYELWFTEIVMHTWLITSYYAFYWIQLVSLHWTKVEPQFCCVNKRTYRLWLLWCVRELLLPDQTTSIVSDPVSRSVHRRLEVTMLKYSYTWSVDKKDTNIFCQNVSFIQDLKCPAQRHLWTAYVEGILGIKWTNFDRILQVCPHFRGWKYSFFCSFAAKIQSVELISVFVSRSQNSWFTMSTWECRVFLNICEI